MEQSGSQFENRPSGLKQPSRLPALSNATTRALQETSQSDLNARSAGPGSMMAPPSVTNGPGKHKISNLPEPPSKRKTLVERAGEPVRSHLPSKSISSISAGFGTRPPSTLSNYRNTSNASTTSSASNVRPSSSQANGARARNGTQTQGSLKIQSDQDQDSDTEQGLASKRKGTFISSISTPSRGITLRKTRTRNGRQPSKQSQPTSATIQHSGTPYTGCEENGNGKPVQMFRQPYVPVNAFTPAPSQPKDSGGPVGASKPSRNVSLSTAFAGLSLTQKQSKPAQSKRRPSLDRIREESPSKIPKFSCTPILRRTQSAQTLQSSSPFKQNSLILEQRTPISYIKRTEMPIFLTKEKLTPVTAWDTKGRLDDMERMYSELRSRMESANNSKDVIEQSLSVYRNRAQELTNENRELTSQTRSLTTDLERARNELHTTTIDLRQVRRDFEREIQDAERRHEKELADTQLRNDREIHRLEVEWTKASEQLTHETENAIKECERRKDEETADLTSQHWEELEELRTEHARELDGVKKELDVLRRAGESRATESASEVQTLRDQITSLQSQLEASSATIASLRSRITAYETKISGLEQEKTSLMSKTHFLEGNQEAQSLEFTTMRQQLQEALDARNSTLEVLRREETLRRKLNATILELKGNIRVFVRTRPLLNGEVDPANVDYPDEDSLEGCKEMVVHAPTTQTATGKQRNEKHNYAFDRVFNPNTQNGTVFEDCRDLVQSVVDGYNVSILSYGQTGSGKTYGMSGPDGIIPSSIGLLLTEIQRLRSKGWDYVVEASFVEVYNETLNDLLGDAKTWDDAEDMNASVRGKKKEKHEIHHDSITGKTTVANLTTLKLWPPPFDEGLLSASGTGVNGDEHFSNAAVEYTENAVSDLLETASKNRRVAATKANERSSRSHSIFVLTLKGSSSETNETSEGVLNLVDLAGSERLKQSGAEGNRMKETQAINKSLSSLGDVIAALGNKSTNGEAHIPYRNSKLTYLLQSSLGGTTAGKSSRTLMLLHLSPLQTHWQESRSSLLFGSKVHGTHIGTAKKR